MEFFTRISFLLDVTESSSMKEASIRINVFPIPDKDTGLNLRKTFTPLLEKFPVLLTRAARPARK